LTREINDEAGFKKYIGEADAKIGKTKSRGSFDPETLLTDQKPSPQAVITADKEKKKVIRIEKPSNSVVPRGFVCRTKHDRVRDIFDELKAISISAQRNSSGVMLRVLLDIALWSFLKDRGQVSAILQHFDPNGRKRGYNADWTPSLRDLISYSVDNHLFPGMTPDGYKAVRSLASKDSSYFITIDGFNEFTHNPSVIPTEGDLRALWLRAEPMLSIILN
jgi:hypothetical protein